MDHFQQIIREELKEVRNDIRDLRRDVNRYKGFIGGVAWAVAALTAGIGFMVNWVKAGIGV